MNTPTVLVTNDDGIHSPFLHHLIEALAQRFRVFVAAPAQEQSRIGRAVSRHRDLTVQSAELAHAAAAWSITGTPTDCVNLALHHLLAERPAAVVSGINVGFNCSMPLLLSSGTLAGAIEGCQVGLPSLAASQYLDPPTFALIRTRAAEDPLPAELAVSLSAAAHFSAQYVGELIAQPPPPLEVHNLNFPLPYPAAPELIATVPALVTDRNLFRPHPEEAQTYQFHYAPGTSQPLRQPTDRDTILGGQISLSRLNLAAFSLPA